MDEITYEGLLCVDFESAVESSGVQYDKLGYAVVSQLLDCLKFYNAEQHEQCIDTSTIILDFIWEKLNQGNWKDVDVHWRYAYTIVSTLKAVSEYRLLKSGSSKVSFAQVMKSCDMGLLMGAPVHDNFLSRVCTCLQKDYKEKQKLKTGSQPIRSDVTIETDVSIVTSDLIGQNHPANQSNTGSEPKTETSFEQLNCHDSITAEESEPLKKKQKLENSPLLSLSVDGKQVPRISCPSLETFRRDYFATKTPVIVTDAMNHWPALSSRQWSLDYIKEKAGFRTVPIEIGSKYTDESWSQKLMTVAEFIERYIEQREAGESPGYLAQHQLFNQVPELQEDIVIPDYCYLGIDPDSVDINAWFGPTGTVSPLHFDPKHNFLAQVIGKKYIRIYADTETDHLYPHSTTLLKNTSQVDIENIDEEKFPLVKEASYLECVLHSGEMLYLPPRYWHFVKSLSLSFSVSFWWE